MRRALLALGSTAAGITLLLSVKAHTGASVGDEAAGTPGASGGSSAVPAAGAAASAAPAGAAAPARRRRHAAARTRTATGSVADTPYGPVQVQLTLVGSSISRVTVLKRTDDGPESDRIDEVAVPRLLAETLTAQSARIDAVSGASYTSAGYRQSLQSALDEAGG
jgi:uncharacterized protein with FMN-binding domain